MAHTCMSGKGCNQVYATYIHIIDKAYTYCTYEANSNGIFICKFGTYRNIHGTVFNLYMQCSFYMCIFTTNIELQHMQFDYSL